MSLTPFCKHCLFLFHQRHKIVESHTFLQTLFISLPSVAENCWVSHLSANIVYFCSIGGRKLLSLTPFCKYCLFLFHRWQKIVESHTFLQTLFISVPSVAENCWVSHLSANIVYFCFIGAENCWVSHLSANIVYFCSISDIKLLSLTPFCNCLFLFHRWQKIVESHTFLQTLFISLPSVAENCWVSHLSANIVYFCSIGGRKLLSLTPFCKHCLFLFHQRHKIVESHTFLQTLFISVLKYQ